MSGFIPVREEADGATLRVAYELPLGSGPSREVATVAVCEYGIWTGGRRVAVVTAMTARQALEMYAGNAMGVSPDDLDWQRSNGWAAASWRGAGFRAEPDEDAPTK